MLRLSPAVYAETVGHCLDGLPDEACGLLLGPPDRDGLAAVCVPTGNEAASSRVYTVDARDLLRADRRAEAEGLQLMGVFHSHTHTEAYPSPTDVASAVDPSWRYVIVSLRAEPVLRSFRIVDGNITEEGVVLTGR